MAIVHSSPLGLNAIVVCPLNSNASVRSRSSVPNPLCGGGATGGPPRLPPSHTSPPRRPPPLPPLEYQLRRLGALLNAPGNLDATRRPAQGAIFQRVGRELVNGKREGFRGLRVKTHRGPADTHLLAFSRIIGQQLLDREVFEINAALGVAGHQRLGTGECVQPAVE